jgi:solute:Na+ symporter, SSS family
MRLAPLDWAILAAVWGVLIAGVLVTRRYMRSVADFLAAGRTAGRYIVSLSQGMAMLGAITIVAQLEMNYVAGFALRWWELVTAVVLLFITVTGWVVYRFRQTRCLTLAEFFERRYSRRFRVFAGLLAYVAGILNFGIFPAVGARFFVYYAGLPDTVPGLGISSYALVMIVLIGTSLFFVFAGGQIAIIVTNFLQGVFVNAVFVWIVGWLVLSVGWPRLFEALRAAPADASLVDPFRTSEVPDFNFGFFLIGVAGIVYNTMAWQGTQAYNASARSAHEARMGQVLANWRILPQNLFLVFVAVAAWAVLHHADFAPQAERVQAVLAGVDGKALQSQLRVSLVLKEMLPAGLLGAFAAVMLSAFFSTHESYLHSWGSIFIQDVVMPFKKRPFTPERHLAVLRWSIAGVAVFIFVFSLVFPQREYIAMFFAITAAIYVGGAGAVIIGGLYWRRGTEAAAWAAMITGAVVSVGGIVVRQVDEDFPINGQAFWGLAMAASTLVYVAVSLLSRAEPFDLDRLLHRGASAPASEGPPERGLAVLGLGRGVARRDRVLYVATYVWTFGWVAVFAAGTLAELGGVLEKSAWERFWRTYVTIHLGASALVLVWFTAGGLRDLRSMFRDLGVMQRDAADDGMIRRGER